MLVEEDLPWLDAQTEIGLTLRQSIVESQMDDDVMTDDEQAEGARKLLCESLEQAIMDFKGFGE